MTYWTLTDDLASQILLKSSRLSIETQDKDRFDAAARYAAYRLQEFSPRTANDMANVCQDPAREAEVQDVHEIRAHKIRRGDRFIHRRFLRLGARPDAVAQDPDNEEFYDVRVVTSVRNGKFYHRSECQESPEAAFSAQTAHPESYVRRWLD